MVKLPMYFNKHHIMKMYGQLHLFLNLAQNEGDCSTVLYRFAPGKDLEYKLDWSVGGAESWSVRRERSVLYHK